MSLRTLFILIGLIYLISPIDLIPDRFGWLSRIDDIGVAVLLWWQYQRIVRRSGTTSKTQSAAGGIPVTPQPSQPVSPWEILEITPPATAEQIEAAYRKLMSQYHPDKVHHLGAELKKVAHEKSIQIQRAYEALAGGC